MALQPETFGLARLSLQWYGSGTAVFSLSGIISNAAGDPINTTFTNGVVSNVPEPSTLSFLAVVALIPLLRRGTWGPTVGTTGSKVE